MDRGIEFEKLMRIESDKSNCYNVDWFKLDKTSYQIRAHSNVNLTTRAL